MSPLASGEFKLAMAQRLPKSCSDGSSAYTLPLRLREGTSKVLLCSLRRRSSSTSPAETTRRRSARSLCFVFDSIRRTFWCVKALMELSRVLQVHGRQCLAHPSKKEVVVTAHEKAANPTVTCFNTSPVFTTQCGGANERVPHVPHVFGLRTPNVSLYPYIPACRVSCKVMAPRILPNQAIVDRKRILPAIAPAGVLSSSRSASWLCPSLHTLPHHQMRLTP